MPRCIPIHPAGSHPGRNTAGEFLYWNKNGGAIALITTTRQIFVSVGVNFNLTLENYLFSLNSDNYHTMAEALRLTKNDPSISGSDQRRLVFFIGDPAMKLAIPKPNIRITEINDILINEFTEPLQGLSSVKIEGQIDDEFGNKIDDYQGELVTTVFDKNIDRSTLGNDGTSQNDSPIILDFTTSQTIEIINENEFAILLITLFVVLHYISYRQGNLPEKISKLKLRYWVLFLIFIILPIGLFYVGSAQEFIYFQF